MDEPRRPGRPRVDPSDRSVQVTVTLPVKQYDDICRRALREGESVPAIIRRRLGASSADDDE